MELDLFKKIIDEAKEFAYDIMLYLGGESLLHPDIVQMVEYTSRAGLISQLNTNATLLTKELSSSLVKAGLSRIVFSFDGYEKETYEKIRVGADFDKTLNNIVEFLKLKQELRSKKPEAIFQIIEFDKDNKEEKRRFKNSLDSLPLNRFKFISPHTFGGRFKEHDKVKGSSYTPCTFLWYSMSILWDGTVVPCCVDVEGSYELGNAKKSSLKDIWNREKMLTLREKMEKREVDELKICSGCDILWKKKFLGVPTRYLTEFIKENL